jgi:plasmid stability protein
MRSYTLIMARTTLMIEESLLRRLKAKAAREGRTLQSVVNDALRRGLEKTEGRPYKLRLKGWKAELQPGVDITDRDRLFDLLDGRG